MLPRVVFSLWLWVREGQKRNKQKLGRWKSSSGHYSLRAFWYQIEWLMQRWPADSSLSSLSSLLSNSSFQLAALPEAAAIGSPAVNGKETKLTYTKVSSWPLHRLPFASTSATESGFGLSVLLWAPESTTVSLIHELFSDPLIPLSISSFPNLLLQWYEFYLLPLPLY